MGFQESFYPESRFGGFTDVCGTVVFYARVNALLDPSSVVLDVGCGRGAYGEDGNRFSRELRILRGKALRVIGMDPDPAAAANPFLDEFRQLDGERWPLDDASVDLCLADCVLEHVPSPDAFFSEAKRVLKLGGHLCLRTANVWSYVGIASRLVPNRLHARVLSKVQENRKAEDVFPTVYRCNSIRKLRSAFRRHGFDAAVYGYEAEPSYLQFSKLAYAAGVLHQRFAPRSFRPAIFAFGRKVG